MRKLSILLVLVFLAPLISAPSIGVNPGFINLGEVNPGTEKQVRFYITTLDMQKDFTVSPEYEPAVADYAMDSPRFSMANVSQQNISPWISFKQETKTIDPSTSQTYTLPGGTEVNAVGYVTMNIDIPANAEPGYRIGSVNLNPGLNTGGGTTQLFATSQPGFAFRLPGTVERELEHVGLEAIRIGEERVQMIHQIRNTGTVTAQLQSGTVNVYNSNGEKIDSYFTTSPTLAPGEYAEMSRTWHSESLDGGEYRIEGTADYHPGEMYISGQFAVTDVIQQKKQVDAPSGGVADKPEKEIPWVLIIILSMLVAILLYLMELDWFWIVSITVAVGFVLYVLLSSASLYLVLIPLASIAVLLYI